MRSFVVLLLAVVVALVAVLFALVLEPVRWCVVHLRPVRRQASRQHRHLPSPLVRPAR